MPLQSFKDLIVWQKSQELTLAIYKNFAACRDYSFRDQIQRAAVSVMNNIAEGYARRSDKALTNFLFIARGSCAEVESMLLLALELRYINNTSQQRLLSQSEDVAKLLTAFINKIKPVDKS